MGGPRRAGFRKTRHAQKRAGNSHCHYQQSMRMTPLRDGDLPRAETIPKRALTEGDIKPVQDELLATNGFSWWNRDGLLEYRQKKQSDLKGTFPEAEFRPEETIGGSKERPRLTWLFPQKTHRP